MGEVRAQAGQEDALREFFVTRVAPEVAGGDGCLSCQVLQDQNDPGRLMVIEVWSNIEAHQAAVKKIPPAMLQEGRALFGDSPAGAYYRVCYPAAHEPV